MKRRSTIRNSRARTKGLPSLLLPMLFLALVFPAMLSAQVSLYTFSQSSGTYTPITGTVVGQATDPSHSGSSESATMDDNTYATVTLPFTFTYNGAPYTGVQICTNGWVAFGTTTSVASSPISTGDAFSGVVAPMGMDFAGSYAGTVDRTNGSNVLTNVSNTSSCTIGAAIQGTGIPAGTTITAFTANSITLSANATSTGTGGYASWTTGSIITTTLGSAPNRIFVVQFKGLVQYSTTSSNANTYTEFQVRLKETTNQIEFVYGNVFRLSGSTTAQVGLRGSANTDYNVRSSTTDWGATTAGGSNSASVTWSSTVAPASGLTFVWTPPPPCTVPTSLAASVTGTATSPSSINGSFTAAAVPPTGYVVVRTTSSTQPTLTDGTTYTVGTNPVGYIEYVGTTPGSWTSNGLTAGTPYYYWVFSYNNTACTGGPKYSVTAANTSVSTLACSFPPGTYTIGATGNLPSLTIAVNYLTACPQTGAYIFELLSDYNPASETYPITFPNLAGSSATNTVTIRPATGSTAMLTSNNATATLRLDGMDYLILDGRPGGTGTPKTLVVENTNTSGVALLLQNDATNNLVQYATLRGVNSSTSGGVILFAGTTGTTGNDNNTIDNCDIRDGATTPSIGILSLGSTGSAAVNNSNNTVSNSNIYNFFSAGGSSFGITLSSGNTDWTVSGNHLYQTASRTSTSGNTHTGINISNTATGNNFVITGNFIGGSTTNAGGTPWTIGGAFANRFVGINVNVANTTASSIQNNTVTNFAWSTSSGATALPGVWAGIYISSGTANVGTVTGNTIGSGTGTGAVTVTSSTAGAVSMGIGAGSGNTVVISNNTIGSISVAGSSASVTHCFNGIWNGGSPTALTISNNLVGSLSTANSIQAVTAATATGSPQFLTGILSTGGTAVSITNNTVANFNNAYVPSSSVNASILRGIASTGGVNTITGNTVRNLSAAANATGSGSSGTNAPSVIGIWQIATGTGGQTVSQNTVYALSNTHASGAVLVAGIHANNPTSGTNVVNANLIHSLAVSSSSATSEIRGISVAGGSATYQNNMIRLGLDATGASLTNGSIVYGIYDVAGTNNHYHNTVYLAGTGVAGTAPTYAFRSDVTTNVRSFVNNIFINARSNGAGTGKHYAIRLAGTAANPAGLTSNYNLYQATGTGAVFGFFNSADVANLAAWQTAVGKDANSIYADPCLAAPTAATPDLHLTNCSGAGSPANAAGGTGTGVTLDFDGQARSGLTPVDIGADAGNYGPSGLDLAAQALAAPVQAGCKTNAETVSATIMNNSANPIDFSVNNATVTVTTSGGYNSSLVLNTGTLASGATQTVTMPATLDMTANGTYSFTVSVAVAGDVQTANDALPAVNLSLLSMGGTYTVGAGGNYTTLTAAVTDYNNASCITAPIIFSLTDANYSASETFPITVNAHPQASAVNTLTIRPAASITPLITGSNAAAIIKLNGADYVTIDGSNNGTATRDLTIQNTNTGTSSITVWVACTATDGATNNTIKNCVVKGNAPLTTLGSIVVSGTAAGGVAEVANNNIIIQNNSCSKAYFGIGIAGSSVAQTGNVITQNSIGSNTAADYIGNTGIFVSNNNGITITKNSIFNIISGNGANPTGINIAAGVINSKIDANSITMLQYTGTDGYGPKGINVNTGTATSNITISNNMIADLRGDGWNTLLGDAIVGIRIGATGGSTVTTGDVKIYNNSVNLGSGTFAGNSSGTVSAALYLSSSTSALDVRNNILRTNLQNSGASSAKTYAIYSSAANTAFTAIDNNDYFVSGTQGVLGFIGSDRTTLAAIQTGFGSNTNSLNIAPVFTSSTDLHLPLTSNIGLVDKGIAIAGIVTDFDGDPRGTTPDVGADEFGNFPATPTSLTQNAATPSCTGGSVLYALPTAPANVTYYLQANATDTSTANAFVGDSILVFTNGTYHVRAKDMVTGLWSMGTASVTVNNIPVAPLPPSPVADQSPACLTTNISVPAPGNPNVTYYWQGTTSGGTSTAQNAATPLTVTASGTYYVAAFDASSNCWSNTNGVAVVIDTQVPAAPYVQPASPATCVGEAELLRANPPIASSASGTGTATTTGNTTGSTLGPNPLQNYYGGSKQQMLFTAAELTTMGVQPGIPFSSVAVQMSTVQTGYNLNALQVKIGPTAVSALSTWITGLTVVRPAATYTPTAGWNTIALPNAYVWNGTDNLVVEINYSNNNTGASSPFNTAIYSTTPNASTLFYRSDNTTAADMSTYSGAPSFTYSSRNNVRFVQSPPAGASVTWAPTTHLFTDQAATTPVTGAADSVYVLSDTTITYTVTSHIGACASTPINVTVTVHPLPVVDAGPTQTVCPGDTVTLSGSGAVSYTWNNGVSNNTPFVATATTLYTVTGTDANGCSDQDTVSVLVKPASPASITPSGPLTFCQNESLTLTAGGPAQGPATVITQWNFNASNLTPSTGTGTASLVGGTTQTFAFGTGSSDAGAPNNAWNTSGYPVQGTGSQTAGVQYNVSTAGYTNVVFSFDIRHSGTAANTYVVQYNPDVTNGFSPWINVDTLTYNVPTTFANNQTVNMSAIPAASNNPNFGVRVVSAFAGTSGAYAPVDTTGGYGTAGTVRYDMVTFTGNPVPYTVSWAPGGQTTYSINPTASGTYTVTVTEPGVCPGKASVNVTVNPVATTVVTPVICADDTYTLVDGTQVNTTGIYTRTTTSVTTGCDSIVVANLTVNPIYTTTLSETICSNETYTLADGTVVDTAGTYTRIVPSMNSCDSTVVVTLSVLPAFSVTVPAAICSGSSYTLPNGTVVSTAGTYTNTFPAANGCDSTIVTNLTVKPVFTSTLNPAICAGDTYTMPDGSTADTAGTYVFPYTAVNSCDSTITVNLTVNPVYTTNITVNICPGETYTLVDGTVVDSAGTYTAVTNSVSNCDSTVVAVVIERSTYAVTVSEAICQGDSYTLVNGTVVSAAGTYTAATQSMYGCDSVVTVNLTVKPVYNQSVSATLCQGGTYQLPDGTQVTAGGTYVSNLTSSGGCDSIITTTLTVSPLPNVNLGADITQVNPPVILNAGVGFSSYDWSTGGQTQTISVSQGGTYYVTVTNAAGCEGSDTITVNFTASVVNFGANGASISLFPNPANERFAISVYGYTGGGNVKMDLVNAIGQVVKTDWLENATESFTKEFDIVTLPSGTYTLRVKGANAEAHLRLIIAR